MVHPVSASSQRAENIWPSRSGTREERIRSSDHGSKIGTAVGSYLEWHGDHKMRAHYLQLCDDPKADMRFVSNDTVNLVRGTETRNTAQRPSLATSANA